MSDIFTKREAIKRAYPHSKTWPSRVDKMPDRQVIAIFFKLRDEGKLS